MNITKNGTNITILNPSDILEVSFGVSNAGNKSAWIRDVVTIDIGLDYAANLPTEPGAFRLYGLDVSREDIRNPEIETLPLAISTIEGFEHLGETEIINGTGANAEIEEEGFDRRMGRRISALLHF